MLYAISIEEEEMVKKEITEAMRKITHGVYVISTKADDKVNALTAAWVAHASFNPPLVSIAVGKTRYTHDLIKKAGVFAINILGKGEIPIGKHFGLTSGKNVDKFSNIEYESKVTGSPILKDALAFLDCRVVSSLEAGDHTIFVGEVLEAGILKDEDPLVYQRRDFFG